MVKPGPQSNHQQGKIGDDGRQGGSENVAALNITLGQALGFGHFHIIFTGVNQEKCPPVVNAEENRADDNSTGRQDEMLKYAQTIIKGIFR